MCKKVLLICAIVLSIVISLGKVAYAETNDWARITTDGVYLYAAEDAKQELFELEKSYYVNMVAQTDDMYQVAVMPENDSDFVQLIGWVKKNAVSKCSAPVEPSYPTVKISVTADWVDLKQSPVPSAQTSCAIGNAQQCCYYGKIQSYGKTWYFVRYAGRMGYVDASQVTDPKIELHPTPLPSKPSNTTPSTTPTPSTTTTDLAHTSSPASEIVLIVFVVVLAVGLTLALFLPGNIKKSSAVFEQDI